MLGDFYTTLCPAKDRAKYVTDNHWKSRTVIKEWLENGDFVDAYRALNPEGTSMTWKKKNFPQTARLDYILLSNRLAGKLRYCKTVSCPRDISDHNGVEAEITLDKSPSGPGTFRAMPNIERHEDYKRSVKYLIREELINLANISDLEKEAEHVKNNNLFETSKSETLTVEAK